MKASEFKKEVYKTLYLLSDIDGPSQNSGVAFFISDMTELFEKWESEEHEYK
jgi:hypothetical protein